MIWNHGCWRSCRRRGFRPGVRSLHLPWRTEAAICKSVQPHPPKHTSL
jgi:hypothetical protein